MKRVGVELLRQNRAGTRANRSESAYGMLTAMVEVLRNPQFIVLINNKYIN